MGVQTLKGGKNNVTLPLLVEINLETGTVDCLLCCSLWEGR